MAMIFRNREEAGIRLATRLTFLAGRNDVVVLAIPRGGIEVAFPVAQALHAPLDIFLSKKLGVPGQEELAFGAVAASGMRYLDRRLMAYADISDEQAEQITEETLKALRKRDALYHANHPPVEIAGKTAILIDDGMATGASMWAAVQALRSMNPARLIVAVPVASGEACERLKPQVDELVCLNASEDFSAIGQFYRQFQQLSDAQVIEFLSRAPQSASRASEE